jgi:hypothetical protein
VATLACRDVCSQDEDGVVGARAPLPGWSALLVSTGLNPARMAISYVIITSKVIIFHSGHFMSVRCSVSRHAWLTACSTGESHRVY